MKLHDLKGRSRVSEPIIAISEADGSLFMFLVSKNEIDLDGIPSEEVQTSSLGHHIALGQTDS